MSAALRTRLVQSYPDLQQALVAGALYVCGRCWLPELHRFKVCKLLPGALAFPSILDPSPTHQPTHRLSSALIFSRPSCPLPPALPHTPPHPPSNPPPPLQSIVAKTQQLSCHTFGCRLVQRVLEHCTIAQLKEVRCAAPRWALLFCRRHTFDCCAMKYHLVAATRGGVWPALAPILQLPSHHLPLFQLTCQSWLAAVHQPWPPLPACPAPALPPTPPNNLCAAPRPALQRAVSELLSNTLQLSHDQFGNYVVQHLVAKGPDAAR